jgi:osmotically-inducible protein OsmY
MPDRASEPEPYVEAHVREALARDDRVGELGLDVSVSDGTITLSGAVLSPERHDAILEVVRELVPDLTIVDQITVQPTHEAGEPEVVG